MKMPLVLKDDDGIRPAGNPDECLYCQQKVGTPHKENCVILNKKVKVRYTYELEIEVPYSWNKEQIEFHRNEGTWCANNSLRELEKFMDSKGCLCPYFECEFLEDSNERPYRKNEKGEIVE